MTVAPTIPRSVRQPLAWATIGLTLATLLLTRHSQIPGLTSVVAPFTIALLLVGLRPSSRLLLVVPFAALAAGSLVYSLYVGNPPGNCWRFFIICVATLLAFCFRPVAVGKWVCLAPLFIQAIGITALSLYLAYLHDQAFASLVRGYVLEQGWGDIYSFDGFYYRVQINGNALLPVLWMICLFSVERVRSLRTAGLVVAGVGLVIAGNLTYLIAAGLSIVIRLRQRVRNRLFSGAILVAVIAVTSIVAIGSVQEILDRKFAGSGSSMATRFDQVRVATVAASRDPIKFVVGFGLGAPFPDGRLRDYSQYNYIELQALYVAYQLGLVVSIVYLLCLLALSAATLNRNGLIIFWLFILSGLSNPYILDSNQIVATILLVCLFPSTRRSR